MGRRESPAPWGSGARLPTWITLDRLESLGATLEGFDPGVARRGKDYASDDRVEALRFERSDVVGDVQGSARYRVSWRWKASRWTPSCDCPVAPECSHAYALACVLLLVGLPTEALSTARWLADLLPSAMVRARLGAGGRSRMPARRRAAAAWTSTAAGRRGAPPSATPSDEPTPSPAAPESHATSASPASPASPAAPAAPAASSESPVDPSSVSPSARGSVLSGRTGAPKRPQGASAAALALLRDASDPWERLLALGALVRGRPRVAYAVFHAPYTEMVEVPDPDLRCWLIAKALHEKSGGWLPDVLAPFHGRPDLEARYREALELDLAHHVADWAAGTGASARRSLRFLFRLREGAGGEAHVVLQVCLRSAKLNDDARTGMQLRQLLGQAQREDGVLPDEQVQLLASLFDPLMGDALDDRESAFVLTGTPLLSAVMTLAGSSLATWTVESSPLMARADLVPGQVVTLGAGTVEITPGLRPGEQGRPRVALDYVLPDGATLGPEERVVLRGPAFAGRREPTLLLARGAFWMTRGDLPRPLAEAFESIGGFTLPESEAPQILAPLAQAYPHFREAIRAHTHVFDVRAVLCLDLREDDWLQLRVFCAGDEQWRPGMAPRPDARVFEWTPAERWQRREAESAPGDDALLGTAREGMDDAGTDAAGDGPDDESARVLVRAPGDDDLAALLPLVEAGREDGDAHEDAREDAQAVAREDADASRAAQAADSPAEVPPSALEGRAPIWIEIPDPARVTPLLEWLEQTGAGRGETARGNTHRDRDVGHWLRLGPSTLDAFAQAWDERPADVAAYANHAARRLLLRPERLLPRVRIESSGVDWFSVSAEWEAEGLSLTDADLARLRAARSPFVKLTSGWVRKDHGTAVDDAMLALAELGVEPGAGDQRVSLWQLAQARPEALMALLDGADGSRARASVLALRERIASFAGVPRVEVPAGIDGSLRPYQRDGLDFLVYTSGLGLGAVLADDMGLGKTLQALAWLLHLRDEDPDGGPTLVVCPASVIHNWEREAERFAPGLSVLSLTAGSDRSALRKLIPKRDLVLTNYALLRRDLEDLRGVGWHAVILDEAQNIKNPDALVSRAARALSAGHRLALTGTPLENRALDLWSIVSFVNPGYLGTRAAFVRRYDRSDAPAHARKLLAARLRPVLLRRLKSQVAPELPARIEERLDCELTAGQRKLYLAELARGRAVLEQIAAAGGVQRNKITILAVLTRLRQICCHPALVGGRESLGSGKFDALADVLEPLVAEGHKVLVFSQFVECLKLIASDLERRGIAYHMLTGASRRRGELVAAFQDDPRPGAFLISLKAGGTGLNLTAASYVVLFDPWWNPAVEAQAIDRTHRIGQDRTVIAYRMLSVGTIEERIWELQQRKATLVRDVLGEDGFAKSLSREDLDYLLRE